MASDLPSSGTREIEHALRGLDPAALDLEFLDRLEAAADDRLTLLTPEEVRFGDSLAGHAPAALSAGFLARLESVVDGTPFAVDEKIVLFPKAAPARERQRKSGFGWAAAAAVALIGGVTALMVPGNRTGPVAGGASSLPSGSAASNFRPAGFNSTANTEDVGVTWQSGEPHRVLRLTYRDKITARNAAGETIEVEQPHVEYIIVPEKMD